MLMRRFAVPLAALTAFATLPVFAAAAPAGAATQPAPLSRGGGGDDGDPERPAAKSGEKVDTCPTKSWTVPLELKGLACILLLPKPEPGGGGGGGGGLGGLLG